MKKMAKTDSAEVRKMVEQEFPGDPALQQVHMARRIIVKEAEQAGMSVVDYVKSLARKHWHGRIAAEHPVTR